MRQINNDTTTYHLGDRSEELDLFVVLLQVENISTEDFVRSILTFAPQPSDDGAIIICVASNPELRPEKKLADDKKYTDNITLNVVCTSGLQRTIMMRNSWRNRRSVQLLDHARLTNYKRMCGRVLQIPPSCH